MMADGGFSVEGQENIQEILSKQLYVCQFLVALGIVRVGKLSNGDVLMYVPRAYKISFPTNFVSADSW